LLVLSKNDLYAAFSRFALAGTALQPSAESNRMARMEAMKIHQLITFSLWIHA
jgi:hypothetical protein